MLKNQKEKTQDDAYEVVGEYLDSKTFHNSLTKVGYRLKISVQISRDDQRKIAALIRNKAVENAKRKNSSAKKDPVSGLHKYLSKDIKEKIRLIDEHKRQK